MPMNIKLPTLLFGLLFWMTGAVAQTNLFGATQGVFDVSSSGAATYRIAIDVPPGIGGLQPQLALSYNSQGGNGVVGLGWSLEGLSAVTRCPKTYATDGVKGQVRHNGEDRYCLDGQRLINVKGEYGANLTEYRTEIESFSRIVSHTEAGLGVVRFTVQTKEGLQREYGGTLDSQSRTGNGAAVRVWALNRITDIKGNKIEFAYYPYEYIDLRGLIKDVKYSGRTVKFNYSPSRPDNFGGYDHGTWINRYSRLESIETFIEEQLVYRTKLTYDTYTEATVSKLTKIEVCEGLNSSCKQPVFFGWWPYDHNVLFGDPKSQSDNIFQPATGWFTPSIHNRTWVVDINGDGKLDILGATDAGLYWHLNTTKSYGSMGFGPGQSQAFNAFKPNNNWFSLSWNGIVWVVDVNGDGLPDILGSSDFGLQWQLNKGNGFSASAKVQAQSHFSISAGWFDKTYHDRVWVTDINGDGLPDILGVADAGLQWQLNTGNGFGGLQTQADHPFKPISSWFSKSTHNRVWLQDINSDGLPDLMGISDSGIVVRLNTGSGFSGGWTQPTPITPSGGWFDTSTHSRVWLADINGDGNTDILGVKGTQYYRHINDGTKFLDAQISNTNFFAVASGWFDKSIHNRIWLQDVDGDGLPDMIGAADSGFYWQRNNGWGFLAAKTVANPQFKPLSGWFSTSIHNRLWLADFNSDGGLDVVGATDSGLYWQSGNSLSTSARIYSIDDFSSRLELGYEPLSNPDISPPAVDYDSYPIVRIVPPMHVVSRSRYIGSEDGFADKMYQYGELRVEMPSSLYPGSGRGMLGFSWMRTIDDSTGIDTDRFFVQAWPYIGSTYSIESYLAGEVDNGLGYTLSTYACKRSAMAAGSDDAGLLMSCYSDWQPGIVYFPFISSHSEKIYSLGGMHTTQYSKYYKYSGSPDDDGVIRQFGDVTSLETEHVEIPASTYALRSLVTNEYHPAKTKDGKWQLGRLKRVTTKSFQQ
jgi:Salmonella virulence plasmid 65kDa B protein/FG-GAP-like repeat